MYPTVCLKNNSKGVFKSSISCREKGFIGLSIVNPSGGGEISFVSNVSAQIIVANNI
jgi:hypothetical protein